MSNPSSRPFGPRGARDSRSQSLLAEGDNANGRNHFINPTPRNVGLGFILPGDQSTMGTEAYGRIGIGEEVTDSPQSFLSELPASRDEISREPSSNQPSSLRLVPEEGNTLNPSTLMHENLFDTPPTSPPPSVFQGRPNESESRAHLPSLSEVALADPTPSPPVSTAHVRATTDPPDSSRTDSPAPASSSLKHWASIRQAFVSTPTQPPTPPPVPPIPSHSFLPAATAMSPPSSKQSRLARLGLRQVVEQARGIAVDVMRQFEDELSRACWIARFGDTTPAEGRNPSDCYRKERESSFGSSSSMPSGRQIPNPFGAAASVFSSGASHQQSPSGNFSPLPYLGLRRPPSLQSITPSALLTSPSLKLLQQTLLRYASSQSGFVQQRLPLETEILAVMLNPFLIAEITSENAKITEDERWIAIATFELLSRHWKPLTPEVSVK